MQNLLKILITAKQLKTLITAEVQSILKDFKLSVEQWQTLGAIKENPNIRTDELPKHVSILAPSISRITKKLEAEGLIKKEPDEKDARVMHLKATTDGRRLLTKIERKMKKPLSSLESKLSPKNMKGIASVISLLTKD